MTSDSTLDLVELVYSEHYPRCTKCDELKLERDLVDGVCVGCLPTEIERRTRMPLVSASLLAVTPRRPSTLARLMETEIAAAHASMDAREKALDEHGYGAPDVIREVIDEHLPASSFVVTPIGTVMHVENHRAAVEAARANGATGALIMLEPARPMLATTDAQVLADRVRSAATPQQLAVIDAPPPFWALCKSLQKRRTQVSSEHYLGCIGHLVKRRLREQDQWRDPLAFILAKALPTETIEDGRDVCRVAGDRDGMALCDLLLTLTDDQRVEVCGG